MAGVVVFGSGPADGELQNNMRLLNMTKEQGLVWMADQFRSRKSLGNLLRSLGVSWGLIGFFIPPDPWYVPASRALECKSYTYRENFVRLPASLTPPPSSLWPVVYAGV